MQLENGMPSPEDIENALSRTGFLLEHKVAQVTRNVALRATGTENDFSVSISYPFPDFETGKSRELDVNASISKYVNRRPAVDVSIDVNLLVECKNSSGPFALIGDRRQSTTSWTNTLAYSFDPFIKFSFPKQRGSYLEHQLHLNDLPGMPKQSDFTGYQLVRLNRQGGVWKADNNGIYDGILYPLAKAYLHHKDLEKTEIEDEDSWKFPGAMFTFPVVVTSSPVFVVDATSDQPEVCDVKWARIHREFHSAERVFSLQADVVSFDYLSDYLEQKVVGILDGAQDIIAKNAHLFDPEWLLSNLGDPKDEEEIFNKWMRYVQTRKRS